MKISTKGRYALRLLIDLAQHNDSGFITLKDIAAQTKHLQKIFGTNRSHSYQEPEWFNPIVVFKVDTNFLKVQIKSCVYDVLVATEGNLSCVACLDSDVNTCPRKEDCATLYIYEGLNQVIKTYLKGIITPRHFKS